MENIDALIYTNQIMTELDQVGFFTNKDPFLERDIFRDEVYNLTCHNITQNDNPMLTEDQFDQAINQTRKRSISNTFDELIDDGFLQLDGMDKDGEFLYGLTESAKIEEKKKKK